MSEINKLLKIDEHQKWARVLNCLCGYAIYMRELAKNSIGDKYKCVVVPGYMIYQVSFFL
uniref:Uncharacterized protein n=1 Tax=Arundo donax TaxID=35708 RepID=A0A0A8Z8W2_ARUDO